MTVQELQCEIEEGNRLLEKYKDNPAVVGTILIMLIALRRELNRKVAKS